MSESIETWHIYLWRSSLFGWCSAKCFCQEVHDFWVLYINTHIIHVLWNLIKSFVIDRHFICLKILVLYVIDKHDFRHFDEQFLNLMAKQNIKHGCAPGGRYFKLSREETANIKNCMESFKRSLLFILTYRLGEYAFTVMV